jgi:PRTRC genetic system ThiF family protein
VSYRIVTHSSDPNAVYSEDARIVVVGCGGTGSYLAEAICRLLIGRRGSLYLVDLDRVEPHNVARQAFDDSDVGKFKAQVLASRFALRFHREVGYSVLPYDAALHGEVFGSGAPASLSLIVGCVDNARARQMIAKTFEQSIAGRWDRRCLWWMDCGNERDSGQILLGNVTRPEDLCGAFATDLGLCRALPAPSLQRADLLVAPSALKPELDCAERVARGDQGPTINQVVAAIAASFVEKLLAGTCSWLGTYFDMEQGTLRTVQAEPKVVSQLSGLHVNALVSGRRGSR